MVLQSAFSINGPTFTFVLNPYLVGQEIDYRSTSSFKTGTLSGSALIHITSSIGAIGVLVNETGDVAILSNNVSPSSDTTPRRVVANISIMKYIQELGGLQAVITSASTDTVIASGAYVPYNDTISQISNAVVVDTTSLGVFTINTSGIYMFDWSVALSGSNTLSNELNFDLVRNATDTIGYSVSGVVAPEIIQGNAIYSLNVNDTIALYNATPGVTIAYDTISNISFMRITTLL